MKGVTKTAGTPIEEAASTTRQPWCLQFRTRSAELSERDAVLAWQFTSRCGPRFALLLFGSLTLAACRAPSPAPPPADVAYEWVVSDAGAGPIAIGMRSDDLQGLIDDLGRIGECVYASPTEPVASGFDRKGLLIMLFDGVVVRVDVIAPGIRTEAGAEVGDTETRIREMYPAAREEPHKYTDGRYLVVDTAPGRRLIFETDGVRVTRFRSGATPQVDWVEGCS